MDVRAMAYRIAQEAIANALTHAQATRLSVELTSREGGVHVSVADDGIGFDVDGQPDDVHGLRSMRERAELASGWLSVRSAPGDGTTVELWLPARLDAGP